MPILHEGTSLQLCPDGFVLRKTILEADGSERNAGIGGVRKSFSMESQWTDTMSGLKTKKLGICWSPKVGDSLGSLAETS